MDNTIIPDSDPSSAEEENVPREIMEIANKVRNNLLPDKSRLKYERAYGNFIDWRKKKNANSFAEVVFLAYFNELAKNHAPSTLWATYSMIKSVVHNRHGVNIHNYSNLLSFLKKNKKGFMPKKSKTLTNEDISRFIQEAPDTGYLAIKVALILGLTGACRRKELCDLNTDDFVEKDDMVVVNIRAGKNDKARKFVVMGEFFDIYKKYVSLRPENTTTKRFFLCYHNNKCSKQAIGINTFGGMPRTVAQFLKLPDPEKYTGHSFRRSSATVLANTGASMLELKRHGGWASDAVAQGYIDDSLQNREDTSRKIMNKILKQDNPSTSTAQEMDEENIDDLENIDTDESHTEDENLKDDKSEDDDREVDDSGSDSLQDYSDDNTKKRLRKGENRIMKKIKLNDGKIINLHFTNCSNIQIHFHTDKLI